METTVRCSEKEKQTMNINEENQVCALVNHVLGKVQTEVGEEILRVGDVHVDVEGSLVTSPASRKKSKLSKARKLICLQWDSAEINEDTAHAQWDTADIKGDATQKTDSHSELQRNDEVVEMGDEADIQHDLTQDVNVEDIYPAIETKQQNDEGFDELEKEIKEFRQQVRLYIHDIILSALQTATAELADSDLKTESDHQILMRSFHDFNAGCFETHQLVIPVIRIDEVADEPFLNGDGIEDNGIDDVVNTVLTNVTKLDDDVTSGVSSDVKHLKLSRHSDILDNIKRSRGNVNITDDSQTSSRRLGTLKSFWGFQKHIYQPNHHTENTGNPCAACEPLLLQKRAGNSEIIKEGEIGTDQPTECVTTDIQYRDVDLPPKRTKAFSRRVFHRLFGSKQSFTPTRAETKSSDIDNELEKS